VNAQVSQNRRSGFGFWLSMAVLVAGYPGVSVGGVTTIVSLCFFGVSLLVAYRAVRRHRRGWEWVRVFSFAGTWTWALLFIIAILTNQPHGEALVSTLGLGAATVAWLWVFQYFRRDAVQQLFPYA
jgi:hypothetical protein